MRLASPMLMVLAVMLLAACGQPEPKGHGDLPAMMLERDPSPDPALVAWANCLQTVTTCLDGGGEVRRCATAEACGANCVASLKGALTDARGRAEELDAFERVFINPGAVCRPSAGKSAVKS
ncbi:MAG TPA: hypothetical protein PLF78_04030 [Caulobacter sp.]|nr:hypothetical protein [Caulobacter sp.]